PSAGETIPVNLPALVDEVVLLTQKQLERMHIRVSKSLHEVPPVQGTPAQLKQVLLNLVLNAAQSMAEGGDLTIEVYPEGQGVVLAVSDTGMGIDDEAVDRIFEPFYSTKNDGTGLGLSVTYGIVQGHGGTIRVRSEVGEGSQFAVWLPCERPESVQPPQ
ncbi:MAG: HAMP domain-containing histidine kinase, partial [Caldilineaceae bacterium]|nr:HAMP domain-containing histidine kinase [Caldilineaceae bacterium]